MPLCEVEDCCDDAPNLAHGRWVCMFHFYKVFGFLHLNETEEAT